MPKHQMIHDLLFFLQASPTPFHAVRYMSGLLKAAGFQKLDEKQAWSIDQHERGSYFVTRNDSSMIAFRVQPSQLEQGVKMLAAHTDSPCLKLKPQPDMARHACWQLGVEVYGGALLNPWFDRDLSLAGRVTYLDAEQRMHNALLDWKRPIATIPNLAIHLDREANQHKSINKQTDLPAVLMTLGKGKQSPSFQSFLLDALNAQLVSQSGQLPAVEVLEHELSFYDTQAPALIGLHDDFVSSARLDNLLSCFIALKTLIDDESEQNSLLVCNDHEEVGSVSTAGAQGSFLPSTLARLCSSDEQRARCMASSWMVSIDNAHAIHPNFFAEKHDAQHAPIMNAGPVLKMNANQRYASNSESSAMFRYCCRVADVPLQVFVVRSDMACGSTIGPITANALGVRTLDIGLPSLAMHSIRELAGADDVDFLYRALRVYLSAEQ